MPSAEPPPQTSYPADVRTADDRRRWDLSVAIASEWYGSSERVLVLMTARSLYESGIAT